MTQPIEFTDSSGRFHLPFLFAGQAQKEFFVNEAHALTDILLHTAVLGEQLEPPSGSVDGDVWLVADSAIGEWAGHDGELAGMQGGVWKFVPPADGMRVFDSSAMQFIVYSNGWTRPTTPTDPPRVVEADIIDDPPPPPLGTTQ